MLQGQHRHSFGGASSSGGDTNNSRYITADEDFEDDPAVGVSWNQHGANTMDSPNDLQAAHERAAAYYYDNGAYLSHDSRQTVGESRATQSAGGGGKFRNKKPTSAGNGQPSQGQGRAYYATPETNVDSVNSEAEASEDDFGFKYRPAIPPPRPLLATSSASGGGHGLSLTLEDTLSMKRQQQQQHIPQPAITPAAVAGNSSSGILLETNIDSELDDCSSIPSSYYPDTMRRQQTLPVQPPGPPPPPHQPQQPQPSGRVGAAFHFNTAVKEEEEGEDETPTEVEAAEGNTAAAASGNSTETDNTPMVPLHEEVPRMASWSLRSPTSPSLTVIENNGSRGGSFLGSSGVPQPRQQRKQFSPYKSPAGTSLTLSSSYSQQPPVMKHQQQQQKQQLRRMPPRMLARLDTDFEVSTDEADFTETTPRDIAILEYSRALEEADRMRHHAGGNYVFAQPPSSQFAGSVPEFINYAGRDSTAAAAAGPIGLRARSMNTLESSSRNSLNRNSGKVLLTPGRARRASLRRSRLGLEAVDVGVGTANSIYSIPVDDSNPALASANSRTNFFQPGESALSLPEVQHHGPVRNSSSGLVADKRTPLDRLESCCCCVCDARCPNTPRKLIVRWALVAGICACCVVLAIAVALIVVNTRPKEGGSGT